MKFFSVAIAIISTTLLIGCEIFDEDEVTSSTSLNSSRPLNPNKPI